MKHIYWRPRSVPRKALVFVAMLSTLGLVLVEYFYVDSQQPYFEEKVKAAQLAEAAMNAIKAERVARGYQLDPEADPTESGMIGVAMSPVTSVAGHLVAKQLSANPDFAAVIVEMLKDAGIQRGDTVAVGCSGSFPALNVCLYAALETIDARPIIVTSASASQWGANIPDFLWIDMERALFQQQLFSCRSVAASLGGFEDRGVGMPREGQRLVESAIERNELQYLRGESFEQSVQTRMEFYAKSAGDVPIKAYVNVGGGAVSVGRSVGKRLFRPGLNLRPPSLVHTVDGVMPRFAASGIPVVNLVYIQELSERYGLPVEVLAPPSIGEANVFYAPEYNPWFTITVAATILSSLYLFVRSSVGTKILYGNADLGEPGLLEPMA